MSELVRRGTTEAVVVGEGISARGEDESWSLSFRVPDLQPGKYLIHAHERGSTDGGSLQLFLRVTDAFGAAARRDPGRRRQAFGQASFANTRAAEGSAKLSSIRLRTRLIGSYAGAASLATALLLSPTQAAAHTSSRRPACTIVGTHDSETVWGTPGDDVICAREGDDVILARGGDDVVYAGRGDDDVVAGAGADLVFGERGRDGIFGGSGPDRLFGQRGADQGITGAGGRDVLSGGRRPDVCLDGRDDRPGDRLRGGPGRDGYAADEGDVLRSVEDGAGCPVQTPPPTVGPIPT